MGEGFDIRVIPPCVMLNGAVDHSMAGYDLPLALFLSIIDDRINSERSTPDDEYFSAEDFAYAKRAPWGEFFRRYWDFEGFSEWVLGVMSSQRCCAEVDKLDESEHGVEPPDRDVCVNGPVPDLPSPLPPPRPKKAEKPPQAAAEESRQPVRIRRDLPWLRPGYTQASSDSVGSRKARVRIDLDEKDLREEVEYPEFADLRPPGVSGEVLPADLVGPPPLPGLPDNPVLRTIFMIVPQLAGIAQFLQAPGRWGERIEMMKKAHDCYITDPKGRRHNVCKPEAPRGE